MRVGETRQQNVDTQRDSDVHESPPAGVVGNILSLQRFAGNRAVAQALVTQRQTDTDTQTDIQRLDEMLDRFNVPESEVISLIGGMSAPDKLTASTPHYRSLLADALDFGEMMRVVTVLPLTLAQKLEWLNAATLITSSVDYNEIQALVTAAPQSERDALKTDAWRGFFVDVCTNATMVTALNDLNYDLQTKLTWLHAEMTITSWELDYPTIQPWITSASQSDRDALKTDAWRGFFVDVCTNATMVTALNDLRFDLVTKLTWLHAELTITQLELDYPTVQPWIKAASQAERDSLKTDAWRSFFVDVCTNATMETLVTDLGWALQDKLRWLANEGCGYGQFKNVINASSDKATALADQPFLLQLADYLSWDDFAKCVELFGRTIPGAGTLLSDATVQAAMAAAWAVSGAAITPKPPAPAPPGVHEEGGYIYLDIITNTISTSRAEPGAQASLPLNDPSPPEHAITIGGFHTHPNVGPVWGSPFASGADVNWANRNGIPLLIRGAFPAVVNVSDTSTGVGRAHLAGDRGFPGATGGTAPQATLDDDHDEL